MGSDGGFVLPLFVKEQSRRVVAIGVNMMRDTTRLSTGTGAMLAAQGDNLIALGGLDSKGCGNDNHNSSVARVVLFDMK